jgi:hypothetical protein
MKKPLLLLALAAALLAPATAAHATPIYYAATLSGAAEATPTPSLGTGEALVTIDTIAHTLLVQVTFTGLLSNDTASHIHCCTASPFTGTAGVATVTPTFTGFPTGVTAGSYSHLFDLTNANAYNPSFVTANGGLAGAEAALAAGMASGTSYLNIHTTLYGGGEIRGFLTPVPEPASIVLFGTGLAGVIGRSLRKRRG